ncbi:MAG: alpha/beta hydrolase [Gemmatimonadetes bacterium]|nr:alpha/beta hydrolase [Gemmatimonadota bacterium]
MAVVDVVAQHGWGFGAWCWDRWRDVLPTNFALHCPDRGYFGPAVAVSVRPRIVLAHSLGLHLLSPQLWATAELIVVISSFRSFHSACARQARRSRRTVEQMLARLEREPAALLTDFYARCDAPLDSRWTGIIDADGLRRDLQLLQESVLELSAMPTAAQVLILHGSRDRVVPVGRAAELRELLPNSAFAIVAEAGHALPLTHARACWERVERAWRGMHPV